MFTKSQFQTLFAYHFHTTFHLLNRATHMHKVETKEDHGYGRGSIHNLFFHILGTDRGWRLGLQTGERPDPLDLDDYPDLPTLLTAFKEEQQSNLDYIESLTDEDIQGTVTFTWRGSSATFDCWRVLQHLVFHGMQHHTEIAQLLTEKGHSPGDIDFIFFE